MWSKPIPPPLPSKIATSSSTDRSDSVTSSSVATNVLTTNGYLNRPRMLVHENNTDLANLWYIPSFYEQLKLFKNIKLDIDELQKRLRDVLRIVSSLSDLIHIVVAYAQLNSSTTNAEQRCKCFILFLKLNKNFYVYFQLMIELATYLRLIKVEHLHPNYMKFNVRLACHHHYHYQR